MLPPPKASKYDGHVPIDLIDVPQPLLKGGAKPAPSLINTIIEFGPEGVPPVEVAYFLHTGRYELLTRPDVWLAAQRAGEHQIAAVVYEQPNRMWCDQKRERANAGENPIQLAEQFAALMQAEGQGISKASIARRFGVDRTYVSHLLRLLRLDPAIRELVRKGALSAGQARPLVSLPPGPAQRIASLAVRHRLPARKVEALAREARGGAPSPKAPPKDPDTTRLEKIISDRIGAPVTLEAGILQIEFGENREVLEGLLEQLGLADDT